MSSKDEGGGDFSHSMTDLMTSLAIVFLILAVAMIVNSKKGIKSKAEKVQDSKKELLTNLNKILNIQNKNGYFLINDKCISIDTHEKYKINIRLNAKDKAKCKDGGLYYENNQFTISPNEELDKTVLAISKIYDEICSQRFEGTVERVQILGHTDLKLSNFDLVNCNKTVGKINSDILQCGNINLSALRAENVFLMLGNQIISRDSNDKLVNCFNRITEISGRGPFDVSTKPLPQEEKRRVEIVISLKQPEI